MDKYSTEALEALEVLLGYASFNEKYYEHKGKDPYGVIKKDLEDYSIIKEIEDNVREGKKVILNDKKYYACEFILAEEGTIRHLTISYNNYKKILRFEDYKKSWKFED